MLDRLRQLIQPAFTDKHHPIELSPVENEYSSLADPESAWEAGQQPARPSSRQLHPVALSGWVASGFLLVLLLLSHSTVLPAIERVDPHRALGSLTKAAYDVVHPRPGLQSDVTIVSAFFAVETGKKHSVADYREWLGNFLAVVEQPIVFYCAPDMREFIQEIRGELPITIIDEWETPYEMPPLMQLGGRKWTENQYKIDPEQVYHVPDVYAIWTAKPWIVKHAKDLDLYRSEHFWWMDAGAFRENRATTEHDLRKMPQVLDKLYADENLPDDTIIVGAPAVPFPAGTDFFKAIHAGDPMDKGDMVQGGFYGGKKAAIDWWEAEVMRVTTLQAGLQQFAGKEQPVWTQTAAVNWNKIYAQDPGAAFGPDCGYNGWFLFLYFVGGRNCTVPAWNGPEHARIEAAEAAGRGEVVRL